MRARGGARARRDARFAPGIETDASRDRGHRARDTHLFRGEVGVSEPNQDSQERVVRPFVVAVDFAYALEEAVPAPDGGLVRVRLRACGWEGGSGRRSVPRRARFAPRSASASLRTRPFAGLNLKNEVKDVTGCLRFGFVSSSPRARAFARGGGRAAPRSAREKKPMIAAIAGRARAGRAATYLLLLLLHVLLRAEPVRLRGTGGRRSQHDGHGDEKPAERGRMLAPRAFERADDARSSRSSRAPRSRERRARGKMKNAPRAGRARRGLPRRTGRVGKPRARRTSRRRGVSSGARTSGRKQLKPSSRSGCPPSRLFTRFTTSPVSDLRIERRRGQQRGRWRPKACVEFEHEKRQWKPRSFSHAPGVLEVAHDREKLLVRLGTRADEPHLHRPDVLQRILGRFPARRDRGSHLTVIDSAPGTRFTRSPEGMRKTTSVRRTRAHDVTRRVYARSIAPNRTRA